MEIQGVAGSLEFLWTGSTSNESKMTDIIRENPDNLVRIDHDKLFYQDSSQVDSNMNESTLVDNLYDNTINDTSYDTVGWPKLRSNTSLSGATYLLPLPIKGITKVGRSNVDCQLIIPSLHTSSVHFWVWCVRFNPDSPPFVYISDMSRNGTFINGVKLGNGNIELLNNGDVVEIKHGFTCVYRDEEFTSQYLDNAGHIVNGSSDITTIPHSTGNGKWYITNRTIGEGSFGEVVIGRDASTNKSVAVKCIKQQPKFKRDKVRHEAEILRNITHPNIIKVLDAQFIENDYFIFQELVCGGDLFSYLTKGNTIVSIPEHEALLIVFQILNALKFLHYNLKVIHRDLKLDNILLEAPVSGTRIVLCDFGIAKQLNKLHERTKTVVGTIEFSAPEVFAGTVSTGNDYLVQNTQTPGYNYKCDIWSLGIITHIMLSGISPFMQHANEKKLDIIERAREGVLDFGSENWTKVSMAAKSFIGCLLRVNHHDRYDVKQCFEHAWIARKKNRLQKIYDQKIIKKR